MHAELPPALLMHQLFGGLPLGKHMSIVAIRALSVLFLNPDISQKAKTESQDKGITDIRSDICRIADLTEEVHSSCV